MLTLKAAGYVDVDAGEIVRPGIVKVDGDRIVGLGGERRGLTSSTSATSSCCPV